MKNILLLLVLLFSVGCLSHSKAEGIMTKEAAKHGEVKRVTCGKNHGGMRKCKALVDTKDWRLYVLVNGWVWHTKEITNLEVY